MRKGIISLCLWKKLQKSGEVLAAEAAAKALDFAEGFGHIEPRGDEPAFFRCVLVIRTGRVWAKMKMMHEDLLSL